VEKRKAGSAQRYDREERARRRSYRPLYEAFVFKKGKWFDVRPLPMFLEEVTKDGKTFPRFQKITDPEIILDPSAILGSRSCGDQLAATIAGFFPYNVPTYAFYAAQVVDSKEANAIAEARKYLFAQPWP